MFACELATRRATTSTSRATSPSRSRSSRADDDDRRRRHRRRRRRRFGADLERTPAPGRARLFTPAERAAAGASLAARFAAKEALAKALGAPRRPALARRRGLTDEPGRPSLEMSPARSLRGPRRSASRTIHVSLSPRRRHRLGRRGPRGLRAWPHRWAHTVDQVRAAEAALMATVPEGALMQRAAAGLAVAVRRPPRTGLRARVLLLVGRVTTAVTRSCAGALLARRGAAVEAVLLTERQLHPGGLAALRAAGGRVVDAVEAAPAGRLLDGIVGIGGRGLACARRRSGRWSLCPDGAGRRGRRAPRRRRRHRRGSTGHTCGPTHRHLRHPQDRPSSWTPPRRQRGWSTSSTSGSARRSRRVEALQAADVAALLPGRAATSRSTAAASSGPGRLGDVPRRGVLCTSGAVTGLAGWSATRAPRRRGAGPAPGGRDRRRAGAGVGHGVGRRCRR